jgi:menaquinone-dependent protoporphyrinogen oxidase
MKVLVSVASRHGATMEIGAAIAAVLAEVGIEVDRTPPERVVDVTAYDAILIGSGVYAGRWLAPARALVERESAVLSTRPVWLFSSGPIGDPPRPDTAPDAAILAEQVHAVEHRVFAGKLDRRQLGIAEKAVVAMVRAADGDYRPWDEVIDWARDIAAMLEVRAAAVPPVERAAPAADREPVPAR